MIAKKYLVVYEDSSFGVVNKIDNDMRDAAYDGYVQIIDITGCRHPKEMTFIEARNKNDYGWSSIINNSEDCD